MTTDDRTVCVHCGKEGTMAGPDWLESVNLGPDYLAIGDDFYVLEELLVKGHAAYDWCNQRCFGQWVLFAATALGSRPRP